MLQERRRDRRRSYSFTRHFRRAIASKGVRRLVTSMAGTATLAGLAFAYCSSDRITGPTGDPASGPVSAHGGSGGGNGTIVTPFPVTEEDIQFEFADVEVNQDMQAFTCNKDQVLWEESRTRGGGVSYFNPKTQVFRLQLRIRTHAKGKGTIFLPQRHYVGYREFEREVYARPSPLGDGYFEAEEEFDLHIIAKGELETRYAQDDYIQRVGVRVRMRGSEMTITTYSKEKCF